MPLRAFVTGAAGFLGRALVAELARRGWEVAALARGEEPVRGARLVRGDLAALCQHRLDVPPFDVLFHLAWVATPGVYLRSPENVAHVEWGARTLRWAVEKGAGRVVVTGTCLEGTSSEEPYVLAKRAFHERARAVCAEAGVGLAWTRIFYPYGPGEHPARLVPSLFRTLRAGGTFPFRGDGLRVRDYVHVVDVAAALVEAARAEAPERIDVGTGEGLALRELAARIARHLRVEPRFAFGAEDGTEPASIVADPRVLSELGFRWRHPSFDPAAAFGESA